MYRNTKVVGVYMVLFWGWFFWCGVFVFTSHKVQLSGQLQQSHDLFMNCIYRLLILTDFRS